MLEPFLKSIIHDKHGRPYSVVACDIDSEIFRRFNIEHRGCRIGYVNYHVEGEDVLFIDDLRFDDKAMRPPWFFIDLFFWIGSLPSERWRVTNYQKRGLGTAMIEFLKKLAKSESLRRIEGNVKHHDFNKNPDLPDWYRRRGFIVSTENISIGVAKVSLMI
jgi:GNAT superfamily N-acetyltransferase